MSHSSVFLGLAAIGLFVACTAHEPADEARGQTSLGKADAPSGSCASAQQQQQQATCGGPGSGQCWCDEACAGFGDCCADAALECGVDECVDDGDCGPGLRCADVDGALDCIAADTCDGNEGDGTVACPSGWRLAPNDAGQAYCVDDDASPSEAVAACETLEVPEYADAYCQFAEDGYYGYSWDACPDPTVASVGLDGEQRCSFSPEALPVGSRHYCHYLEDGYFGFYWSLEDDPDYACPEGMRRGDNNVGTGFCTVRSNTMPGPVVAECADDGSVVGFAWKVGCSA